MTINYLTNLPPRRDKLAFGKQITSLAQKSSSASGLYFHGSLFVLHFPGVSLRRTGENIEFTPHAIASLRKRGVSQEEVIETINEAEHFPTKLGRMECEKEFCYNAQWHGKYYHVKKVCPVFKEEEGKILIITVYSFYH